jgi:hypothetical protein
MGNRKETRQKVRAHVLSFFDQDHYGSDNPDATAETNVHEQVKAMLYPNTTIEKVSEAIVDGGTLLVYHHDVVKFVDGLGLNPLHKEYEVMEAWSKYVRLCGREIRAIYEEIEKAL